MTNKNILTDLYNWIKLQSIITNAVNNNIWKYSCRNVNGLPFGKSNSKALVIDLLPGIVDNQGSSQYNTLLNVKGYASDTITDGKKTIEDSEDKCIDLFYIFDSVLNRKDREIIKLTNFLILGMFRTSEFDLLYDDMQECIYCTVNYDITYLLT